MARRLPPLNALQAFEAAARHLSFTRAGEELSVTQAAISHQVKALEERLGVRLFRRVYRGLLLTEEGQRLFPPAREAFDRLAEASDRLRRDEAAGTLTVSTLDSLAAKWLVPRLARFRERHPDIEVRLSTNDALADFGGDGVDLAVRYGRGKWPGVRADRLLTEDFFPVCSPRLRDGPKPLRRPEDLRRHTLLHEEAMHVDWKTWLMAAGVGGVDTSRGPVFWHGYLVLAAAVEGQGVALGRTPLVDDDLAAGRLVKPFDLILPSDWAHYIVSPEATADRPKIAAFRQWLMDEAGAVIS